MFYKGVMKRISRERWINPRLEIIFFGKTSSRAFFGVPRHPVRPSVCCLTTYSFTCRDTADFLPPLSNLLGSTEMTICFVGYAHRNVQWNFHANDKTHKAQRSFFSVPWCLRVKKTVFFLWFLDKLVPCLSKWRNFPNSFTHREMHFVYHCSRL